MKPSLLKSIGLGLLFGLGWLAISGRAFSAAWPHYDEETLCYIATDIVEATILASTQGSQSGRITNETPVRVERVLFGSQTNGAVIKIKGLHDYKVMFDGEPATRMPYPPTRPLDNGDRVVLFLEHARERFANWSGFGPIPSGVRMITNDTVRSFAQFSAPGFYTARFDRDSRPQPNELSRYLDDLSSFIKRGAMFRERIQGAVSTQDSRELLSLLRERASSKRNMGFLPVDPISHDILGGLIKFGTHDDKFEALTLSWEWSSRSALLRAFESADGAAYLAQVMKDRSRSSQDRVTAAKALTEVYDPWNIGLSMVMRAKGETWFPDRSFAGTNSVLKIVAHMQEVRAEPEIVMALLDGIKLRKVGTERGVKELVLKMYFEAFPALSRIDFEPMHTNFNNTLSELKTAVDVEIKGGNSK